MVTAEKTVRCVIEKFNEDQRIAFGRAYTSVIKGRPVVDNDGDLVEVAELEKAAQAFASQRAIKVTHRGRQTGELVESLVTSPDKARAMGLPADSDVAWWVGVRIDDGDAWAAVKRRELREFSFGGDGVRTEIPRPENAHVSPDAPAETYRLHDLELKELSLVPLGAGEDVPIMVIKTKKEKKEVTKKKLTAEDVRKLFSKAGIDLSSLGKEMIDPEQLAAQLQPLQGVMETVASLVDGAHAAGMQAGSGSEGGDKNLPNNSDDPETDPKKTEDDDDPDKKGGDMPDAMKQRLAALEKELETSKARQAALEARAEREEALGKVRDRWGSLPLPEDALVAIQAAATTVEKSSGSTAEIVLPRATMDKLLKALDSVGGLLKESEAFKTVGSRKPGRAPGQEGALKELDDRVSKLMKDEPKITQARAMHKIFMADPDLAARVEGRKE